MVYVVASTRFTEHPLNRLYPVLYFSKYRPRNDEGELADPSNSGIIDLLGLHWKMQETTTKKEKATLWNQ